MMNLYIITAIIVVISFIVDSKKTLMGIKSGFRMFLNLLPSFLTVLILLSIVLALVPMNTLQGLLGSQSGILGYVFAAVLGSIALIPGFVSYPMAAILIKNGVGYPIIAVFITTLMMVGIVTFPLEKKFFGWKVALVRNSLFFIGALIIGSVMALLWNVV
ncbi:MAG: hypothetical protein RBS43_07325 [Candidatus Cloacimonas sp.]|jgi:uncharacterized membrane protein YraQ (UPF0718 family)|nr:hypothetical protein [Candidatus Cloacimonas sp.]